MVKKYDKPCVICGRDVEPDRLPDGTIYWDGTHNAEPLKVGRCCNDCNGFLVIPARMRALKGANDEA